MQRWKRDDVGRAALFSAAAAVSLAVTAVGYGGEPRWSAMAQRIDGLLETRAKTAGLEASVGRASDAEFLRRTSLDLIGRIPHVSEARAFFNDQAPDRRQRLVERLLTNPQHATHLANVWKTVLLSGAADLRRYGNGLTFHNWLRGRFADNRPYDEMIRELLTATGPVNGPALFYGIQQGKPENLAASTSRALLGVQIQCAQCHNHPFDHWKQEDFWGYAAFFAQLQRPRGRANFLSQVQDTDQGEVKMPGTEKVVPPRFLGGVDPAPQSGSTRRAQLAEWFTASENPYFAKATVNRVWALLFGRGLVHPVDDLGAHNPTTHPTLLNELAAYFVETGYDVRELLRALANTRAYSLASGGAGSVGDPAEELVYFRRMAIKSLTAEQLYDCLLVATCRRDAATTTYGFARIDRNRQLFIERFRQAQTERTEYQSGIPQALTLMNGREVSTGTDIRQSDLLLALEAPFFTDSQRLDTMFLATLCRYPRDREREKFAAYLARPESAEGKRQAQSDILWALLNSAEFTLNH